jgi:hypothetical protein
VPSTRGHLSADAAFEIAEKDGDRLDSLFIRKVFEPFFPDLVGGDAILALLLGLQIQLFELIGIRFPNEAFRTF